MSPVRDAHVRKTLARKRLRCVLVMPAWSHRYSHPTGLRKMGTGFWTPISLLYPAASVRQEHDVAVLDGGFFTPEGLMRAIASLDPDAVGFYCSTVLRNLSREQIAACRAAVPKAHLTVGGRCPLSSSRSTSSTPPSATPSSWAKESTPCGNFAEGETLEGVMGLLYRRDGEIVENPPRPFITDLDSLPSPARDLIDVRRYTPPIGLYAKKPVVTGLTLRGCHHRCLYCYKWGGYTIRFRSPENVVEEMAYLVKTFGVREIRFWDDTFAADRNRVFAMAELVAKRGVKVDVSIGTRADTLDRELLRALKQIGVYNIIIGVESGVAKNLVTLRKEQTLEQVREAVRLTHEAGIRTFLTSIFGIPGETYEEGLETIRFVRRLKPDAAHFFTMCPFPGTDLYRDLAKYGKVVEGDYSVLGMHTLPFEPYTMTRAEIEALRRKAFVTTTLYPEFILRRILHLRSFEEVEILFRGAATVFLSMLPAYMHTLREGRTRPTQPTAQGIADC